MGRTGDARVTHGCRVRGRRRRARGGAAAGAGRGRGRKAVGRRARAGGRGAGLKRTPRHWGGPRRLRAGGRERAGVVARRRRGGARRLAEQRRRRRLRGLQARARGRGRVGTCCIGLGVRQRGIWARARRRGNRGSTGRAGGPGCKARGWYWHGGVRGRHAGGRGNWGAAPAAARALAARPPRGRVRVRAAGADAAGPLGRGGAFEPVSFRAQARVPPLGAAGWCSRVGGQLGAGRPLRCLRCLWC
jgi:hypothetical protein